jgi:transposase
MLSFQFTCLIRPIDQGPSHHSVAGFVACADAEPPVARSGKPGGEPARPAALVCRTTARFRPRCRRHRHHGQSRQPQVGSAPPHDQGRRSKALVLPPYPPDLNPIEQAFAKIKHWRRAAQKRTTEDAWRLPRQRRIRFRQNVKRSRVRPSRVGERSHRALLLVAQPRWIFKCNELFPFQCCSQFGKVSKTDNFLVASHRIRRTCW